MAEHEDPPRVKCPKNGKTVLLGDDGTYTCDHCGEDIEVEDGVADHA